MPDLCCTDRCRPRSVPRPRGRPQAPRYNATRRILREVPAASSTCPLEYEVRSDVRHRHRSRLAVRPKVGRPNARVRNEQIAITMYPKIASHHAPGGILGHGIAALRVRRADQQVFGLLYRDVDLAEFTGLRHREV